MGVPLRRRERVSYLDWYEETGFLDERGTSNRDSSCGRRAHKISQQPQRGKGGGAVIIPVRKNEKSFSL